MLEKERQGGQSNKDRENALGKQIDDLITEKKKLSSQLSDRERELMKAQQKAEDTYDRFQAAIAKVGQLEKEIKQQEDILVKRNNEINSLLKENRYYKGEVDTIRTQYGGLEEIEKKF